MKGCVMAVGGIDAPGHSCDVAALFISGRHCHGNWVTILASQ